MKNKKQFLFLFLLVFLLSGCTADNESSSPSSSYKKITAEEAKTMIDQDNSVTILDVRTEEEYNAGHIENAILIPDTSIIDTAESILTDKSATILVYCRSGRRSALAAANLVDLGYTNIYDFGGIIDWEYDIVIDETTL